jgi:hypothetical protein
MGRRGNGEGSITRHKKSGLYMARYWVEMPTGAKRKSILRQEKREEVAEKLVDTLSDRNKGLVFDDENTSVGETSRAGSRIPPRATSPDPVISAVQRVSRNWTGGTPYLQKHRSK